jgi:hypothetical protein
MFGKKIVISDPLQMTAFVFLFSSRLGRGRGGLRVTLLD